ncbi:MAG: hypothetical protein M3R68_01770 [Acidobacteriota bacterium]|nr:hypothetical protein [Acidobacteriota bacterium]
MAQVNLQELDQDILQRLSAVDMLSVVIDKRTVESVLENYLDRLHLSARPVRWARDGQNAHSLAARSDLASVNKEVGASLARVFRHSFERSDERWVEARDNAKAAGHGRQLEVVLGLVHGFSVLLSIPWSRYEGAFTGDRGRRTNPTHGPVWTAAADVLEYAARARAECAWRCATGSEETRRESYEDIWLPFVEAFEAGLWFFWITPAEVIALPRPVLLLNGNQLHSSQGPAVSWMEGEEEYFFLNDVHVSRVIVETPASQLDPRLLLKERNTEVRREMVRKIGIERVCQALEAKCLDRQDNYELLLLDLQDGRTRPFLKMKNPSIGVYHIEGVSPECTTVAEALAWRNQSDVPPTVLT